MIQVYGWSKPRPKALGIHSAWIMAMNMPVKPRVDPIDRSMLRDTMMSTMPVAMIATAALWTDRFHRLRGVRNRPDETMLKTTQMREGGEDQAKQARVDLERLERGHRRPPRRFLRDGGVPCTASLISAPR